MSLEPDLGSLALNNLNDALPQHSRSALRIVEFVDQGLDHGAPGPRGLRQEGVLDGREQREPLDPLRRPLGHDLVAGDAPDLLGVGLEEDLE